MLELLIVIGRALVLALRGHQELVLENLALRQQLTAVKRMSKRSPLGTCDRVLSHYSAEPVVSHRWGELSKSPLHPITLLDSND